MFQASFLAGLELQTDEVYDLRHDSLPDDPLDHSYDLPNVLPSEGLLCDPDSVHDDHLHDLQFGLIGDVAPQDDLDDFSNDSYPKDLQDFDLHGSSDDDLNFPPRHLVPVETFNPLTYPDTDLLMTYDFPCRNDPQVGPVMVVVEPQTLPQHIMSHVPLTSLPHLPQPGHPSRSLSLPCLSGSLPPSLSLADIDHLDSRNHFSLQLSSTIGYSDDDVFLSQEEEEEMEEEERQEEEVHYANCLSGSPPDLPRSRPPSINTNWRLSDGEGQFFPSFSQ